MVKTLFPARQRERERKVPGKKRGGGRREPRCLSVSPFLLPRAARKERSKGKGKKKEKKNYISSSPTQSAVF